MMVGARIIAPEGFQCFGKGVVYHFLNSDSTANRVKLVYFDDRSGDLTARLINLTQVSFEEALEQELLVEDGVDLSPPWLESIHGYSIAHLESRRISYKENYDQKVDRRYVAISELVLRFEEVLGSANPDAIINAHAKAQKPQQNAKRLRFWFYSYIVFGFNKWALMPLLHRIGGWNRENYTKTKHGRPSYKGRKSGYNCTPDMKEKIFAGVLRHKDSSGNLNRLYREILIKEFGCIATDKEDIAAFIHPNSEPFPSQGQFYYWMRKLTKPKSLAHELKGSYKAKAQSGSMGSFAEGLTNLCQEVEFDGYNISEKLSGITEGSAVDGYCVVRALCGLSGAVLGIGFAEGAENMDAYKMALFSMAVDKVKFCELFGININPEDWSCFGLPGGIIFDRGPGATYKTDPHINWLGSLELPPSRSGQSKATVESSHPRDKQNLDQPTYFHSKLNFVRMARRELVQVLLDNRSSDASGRMTEEMIINRVRPTPHGIWAYLDSRGRNSARGMPFDEAVRTFLTVHPATVRKDAVYFYGRKYRSESLIRTDIFDRVARNGVIHCRAYSLVMCVRHIWIELEGLLYELDFLTSASTPEGSVDITLSELREINEMRLVGKAALRDEVPAIEQIFRDRFRKDTGEDWDSGQRKQGRPSKAGAARRDTEDFNRFRGKAK